MKLDDPGSASSSADSATAGDTVDETVRNQSGRDQVPVPDSARNHPMSRDAMFAGASRGLEGAAEEPSGSGGEASGGPRPADSSVHSDAAADTMNGDAGGEQGGAVPDGTADGTGPAGPAGEGGETTGIAEGLPLDPVDSGNGQLNDRDEGQAAVLPDAEVSRPPAAIREAGEDSGTRGGPGDLTGTRPGFAVIDAQAEERGDERAADEAGTSRRPEGRAAPARESQEGTESASGDRAESDTEDSEKAEPTLEDQPREQDRKPLDVNPAQPDETGPEASPDTRLDDQRPLTVADARALIAETLAENNAKHEAELDEQKAKHEAETEELKAEYESRLSALEAKVEGGQEDQAAELPTGDRTPEDETRPDAPDTADERSAEQRGDRLPQGVKDPEQAPDDPFNPQASQDAAVSDRQRVGEARDATNEEPSRWRRLVTSDRVSAAGTVASAVNSAALFGMHASPEGLVSLGMAILGVAGLGLAKAEKRRKEKNERQD